MAANSNYDLMVLLDTESAEYQRAKALDQVRNQIADGNGSLKGDADWGLRRLAYEIDHRTEALYHQFDFDADPKSIEPLSRNLLITEGVLRFRVFDKLERKKGEPVANVPPPAVAPEPEPAVEAIVEAETAPSQS